MPIYHIKSMYQEFDCRDIYCISTYFVNRVVVIPHEIHVCMIVFFASTMVEENKIYEFDTM